MLSPHRAVSRSLAELPGEVSRVGLVILAAPACGTEGLLPLPDRWHGVAQTPFEPGRLGNYHRMPGVRAPSRRAWRNGWRIPGTGGY
jgi:hypothetical protein